MSASANMAGFLDAQQRLREQVGIDAVFVHPGQITWPAGTAINPETGEPYDPFVTPESSIPDQRETVRCGKLTRAMGAPEGRIEDTAIGSMTAFGMALTFSLDDWDRVDGAETVEAEGDEWRVRQLRRDELGGRGMAFLGHQ